MTLRMLYHLNMRAVIILIFSTLLTFALPSVTYAKSGGYNGISEIDHYTVQQDNFADLYPAQAVANEDGGNIECEKYAEHSCQSFSVLACKIILFFSGSYLTEDIRHASLRAQISFSQDLKPPRL